MIEFKIEGVRFISVFSIEYFDDYKEWIFILRDDLKWFDEEKIIVDIYLDSWLDSLENLKFDEIYRMFVIKGVEDFYNKKVDKSFVGFKI